MNIQKYRGIVMPKILLGILAIALMLQASCRKKNDDARWNTRVLAPLAKTALSLADIVGDSNVVEQPDHSIHLVEDRTIADITIDTLVSITTEPFLKTAKLSSLTVTPAPISRSISLGEIANQLIAQGGTNALIGHQINANNGTIALIPSLNNLTAGPFDIDISSFFLTATFLSGDMIISIDNGFPVAINHAAFSMKNKGTGIVFATPDFTNIAPGNTQTVITDLSGKTVDAIVQASATDLDLAGGFVAIDTSDEITITISLANIELSGATAIFPAQNIVDETTETYLEGMGEVELTRADIGSGELVVEVVSTVQDSVFFTYTIPNATKNSVPFTATRAVPPAQPGVNVSRTFTFDFSDYILDLTGDPARVTDTVNTLYSSFVGRIEYTGEITTLTLNDSVMFYIHTENLKPSYAAGYLGRDTLANTGVQTLDFFNSITGGTLNFEQVNLKFEVKNGMGVDGLIKVHELKGQNTRTGEEATLNIPSSIVIPKATDNPLMPSTTTVDLSADPSTTAFMNILPDKISYNVEVISNPAGNTHTYTDFAYRTSSYSTRLLLEVPLSIIASDLVLSDTSDFNNSTIKQNITSGTFRIIADNGFPLDAQLWLYFLDENGAISDSLASPTIIEAAAVDGSFIVTGPPTQTVVTYEVSAEKMQHLYHAKKVIFKVKFNTVPGSPQYLKLYSDYNINFKITGDVEYMVQ